MKKRVCACLLACLLCLSGCGREPEEASGWTALQMARAILASQGAAEAVTELDGADFAAYAGQCYQLDPRQVEDGAVLAAGGVSALEIAVLRLTEDGAQAAEALEDYIAAGLGPSPATPRSRPPFWPTPQPSPGGGTQPCSSAPIQRRPGPPSTPALRARRRRSRPSPWPPGPRSRPFPGRRSRTAAGAMTASGCSPPGRRAGPAWRTGTR